MTTPEVYGLDVAAGTWVKSLDKCDTNVLQCLSGYTKSLNLMH